MRNPNQVSYLTLEWSYLTLEWSYLSLEWSYLSLEWSYLRFHVVAVLLSQSSRRSPVRIKSSLPSQPSALRWWSLFTCRPIYDIMCSSCNASRRSVARSGYTLIRPAPEQLAGAAARAGAALVRRQGTRHQGGQCDLVVLRPMWSRSLAAHNPSRPQCVGAS